MEILEALIAALVESNYGYDLGQGDELALALTQIAGIALVSTALIALV